MASSAALRVSLSGLSMASKLAIRVSWPAEDGWESFCIPPFVSDDDAGGRESFANTGGGLNRVFTDMGLAAGTDTVGCGRRNHATNATAPNRPNASNSATAIILGLIQ